MRSAFALFCLLCIMNAVRLLDQAWNTGTMCLQMLLEPKVDDIVKNILILCKSLFFRLKNVLDQPLCANSLAKNFG